MDGLNSQLTRLQSTANQNKSKKVGLISIFFVSAASSTCNLFLLGSMFSAQPLATIGLLILALIICAIAAFGWLEYILLRPEAIGGISAVNVKAFKKYNPVIPVIAAIAYWFSWIVSLNYTSYFVASAFQQFYFPNASISLLATLILTAMGLLSLLRLQTLAKVLAPIIIYIILFEIFSGFAPVFSGNSHWQQALTFKLNTPFNGIFGQLTAFMSCLYLLFWSIPSFELVGNFVNEMENPGKNMPKLYLVIIFIIGLFYIIVPILWIGTLGIDSIARDHSANNNWFVFIDLFKPYFDEKFAYVITFTLIVASTFTCGLTGFVGASRVLKQLALDDMIPKPFAWTIKKTQAPWFTILIMFLIASILIWSGAPSWLMAATNMGYLTCLILASIGVYLLRKEDNSAIRLYRAPNKMLGFGLLSGAFIFISIIFGFQQYGLKSVLGGILFYLLGSILYFLRNFVSKKQLPTKLLHNLAFKLTMPMFLVLSLDAAGYLIAVVTISETHSSLIVALEDIFVLVAFLTIAVGFILPGMIANAAKQVTQAAHRLTYGTLNDFVNAMKALSQGQIEKARADINVTPIVVNSNDEIGEMANSFNQLQEKIKESAVSLQGAREGLREAKKALTDLNINLEHKVIERTQELHQSNKELQTTLHELKEAQAQLIESEKLAFLGNLVAGVAHEINTPLGVSLTVATFLQDQLKALGEKFSAKNLTHQEMDKFLNSAKDSAALMVQNLIRSADLVKSFKQVSADGISEEKRQFNIKDYIKEVLKSLTPELKKHKHNVTVAGADDINIESYPGSWAQIITNLVLNSIIHGFDTNMVGNLHFELKHIGDNLEFIYTDDGKGIAKENLSKIFEPFYTTKRNQGCTGLGMHIVYNIVAKNLAGTIRCLSELGHGVKFIINCPITSITGERER